MPVSVVEPNKHWRPCHKRAPEVVIECVEAAFLAAFLRHLRGGLCFLGKWLMSYDLKRNLGLKPTNRPLAGERPKGGWQGVSESAGVPKRVLGLAGVLPLNYSRPNET